MKNIIKLMIAFCLLTALVSSVAAAPVNAECQWYIKRCGTCRPTFPREAEEVARHSAYFIDERYTDTTEQKRLYLTFDAGYENGNVAKILDTLREENVPAAFFLLDNIILKNADLVRRMADEGHLVCNHTRNHKCLAGAPEEKIRQSLESLEKICKESAGVEMAKYFRFPEGRYSISALKTIESLGYKTIFWSFAYDDWDNERQKNPDEAIKKILENTHNGAVILLHPTSSTNAQIMPTLISQWRKMGYTFGTLDELTESSAHTQENGLTEKSVLPHRTRQNL